jgi:hypothetical protein
VELQLDGNGFHLSFEKTGSREPDYCSCCHYRSGVPVQANGNDEASHGENEDGYVFRGFNRRNVKKSPKSTSPGKECNTYVHYSTNLALWLGGGTGISPTEFLSLYDSQSGRGGGALAASNAGIPLELWGQHGD